MCFFPSIELARASWDTESSSLYSQATERLPKIATSHQNYLFKFLQLQGTKAEIPRTPYKMS